MSCRCARVLWRQTFTKGSVPHTSALSRVGYAATIFCHDFIVPLHCICNIRYVKRSIKHLQYSIPRGVLFVTTSWPKMDEDADFWRIHQDVPLGRVLSACETGKAQNIRQSRVACAWGPGQDVVRCSAGLLNSSWPTWCMNLLIRSMCKGGAACFHFNQTKYEGGRIWGLKTREFFICSLA